MLSSLDGSVLWPPMSSMAPPVLKVGATIWFLIWSSLIKYEISQCSVRFYTGSVIWHNEKYTYQSQTSEPLKERRILLQHIYIIHSHMTLFTISPISFHTNTLCLTQLLCLIVYFHTEHNIYCSGIPIHRVFLSVFAAEFLMWKSHGGKSLSWFTLCLATLPPAVQ